MRPPDLAKARATIRDTGKWLAVAFATVGGVIISGLQFSDLASIESGALQAIAVVAAVVAIAGVGVALWATTEIITPSYKWLGTLAQDPETNRKLLESGILGSQTLPAFIGDYRRLSEEVSKLYSTPGGTDTDEYKTKAARHRGMNEQLLTLTELGNYEFHLALFVRRRFQMFIGAGFTLAGIVVFVLVSKGNEKSEPPPKCSPPACCAQAPVDLHELVEAVAAQRDALNRIGTALSPVADGVRALKRVAHALESDHPPNDRDATRLKEMLDGYLAELARRDNRLATRLNRLEAGQAASLRRDEEQNEEMETLEESLQDFAKRPSHLGVAAVMERRPATIVPGADLRLSVGSVDGASIDGVEVWSSLGEKVWPTQSGGLSLRLGDVVDVQSDGVSYKLRPTERIARWFGPDIVLFEVSRYRDGAPARGDGADQHAEGPDR